MTTHNPQEALEMLRAAQLLFQLEHFEDQNLNPSANSHPPTLERAKIVQQAILLLEQQISADLARQAPIESVNTPRIIEISQNVSDDANMESPATDTPATQSDEQVSSVAKNTNAFWNKNKDRNHESHVDTHRASLPSPSNENNRTVK